jgi:hypothetical protein
LRGFADEDAPKIQSLEVAAVCLSGLDPEGRGQRTARPARLLGELIGTGALKDSLTALDLSRNSISLQEMTALFAGLRFAHVLKSLNLSSNSINAGGALVINQALLTPLEDGSECGLTKSLTLLDLSHNALTGHGVKHIVGLLTAPKGPRALRCLNLCDTQMGDEGRSCTRRGGGGTRPRLTTPQVSASSPRRCKRPRRWAACPGASTSSTSRRIASARRASSPGSPASER